MIRALLFLALLAGPATGQEDVTASDVDDLSVAFPGVVPEVVRVVRSGGVVLKGLDKVSGDVTDVVLRVGETVTVGRVEVDLGECRYFEDNPAGEGFAWLTIRDSVRDAVVFDGWMIASSPALNALDHPRYDVWVIRCTTA
ncbi:MAG: DUF2155 domain-containing protein [Boseongicola sp.]|nr:DUF2155 domain-containing protein [Boseongicola sp.]